MLGLYIDGGNVTWWRCFGKSLVILEKKKKISIELSRDSKKWKASVYAKTCTQMFIAVCVNGRKVEITQMCISV